jgi:hypothetical protein
MTRAALTQIKDGSAENFLRSPIRMHTWKRPHRGAEQLAAPISDTRLFSPSEAVDTLQFKNVSWTDFPKQDRTSSGVRGVCPR